jgi:hypothetical protein
VIVSAIARIERIRAGLDEAAELTASSPAFDPSLAEDCRAAKAALDRLDLDEVERLMAKIGAALGRALREHP